MTNIRIAKYLFNPAGLKNNKRIEKRLLKSFLRSIGQFAKKFNLPNLRKTFAHMSSNKGNFTVQPAKLDDLIKTPHNTDFFIVGF